MDNKLLKRYLEYANTEEAKAVLFVKKYLEQSKGYWIDIVECEQYQQYEQCDNSLRFRFVECGLYKRILKPKYPPKSDFVDNGKFNEHSYYLAIRAITWETAHLDIEEQKRKSIKAVKYRITGVSYDKNRKNKNFFRDDAPPDIKALANNLSDRTSPLWDYALEYRTRQEYVYKIKRIEKLIN